MIEHIQSLNNFKAMMLWFILFGLLAASATGQDLFYATDQTLSSLETEPFFNAIEGYRHPHFYSEILWFETQNPYTATQTFTRSIPAGVFDSTENIYTAASIMGLSLNIPWLEALSSDQEKLVFYVDNIEPNAARTSIDVTLSFISDSHSNGQISQYEKIGLSVLLIGSGFSGSSDTVESSYIYAKMGKLTDVIDQGSDDALMAQFDFKNGPSDSSPFDYQPGPSLGNGCGSIVKQGKTIIESNGCQLSNFYAFVTGFVNSDIQTSGDGNVIRVSSYINPVNQAFTVPSRYGIQYQGSEQQDSSDDNSFIFKTSENDQNVGLWISYVPNDIIAVKLQQIQFSFVHVGIRDYTDMTEPNPYPLQNSANTDSFIFISAANRRLGQRGTAAQTDSQFVLTNDLSINQKFNGDQLLTTFLQGGQQFGHAFCGSVRIQGDKIIALNDIQINSGTAQTIRDHPNHWGVQCLFLANRDPCLTTSVTVQIDDFPNDVSLTGDIEVMTGPATNAINEVPAYNFLVDHGTTSSDPKEGTVSLDFGLPTVTEYYLRIKIDSNNARNSNNNEVLKVEVQGQVIYDGDVVQGDDDQEFDFVLPFHSNGDNLDVLITYQAPNGIDSSSGTDTELQIALVELDDVLNPNGVSCLDSCPEIMGFDQGLILKDTTFVCLYCDQSLNQQVDSFTGECKCMDFFTQDFTDTSADLVCVPCADDPLCATCTLQPFTCSKCAENAQLVGGVCQCLSGFYPSGSQCIPCAIGCVECSSEYVCSACKDSTNSDGVETRDSPATGCQCKDGFFEQNNELICIACDPVCKTCSQTADTCTSCDTDRNFEQVGSTCVCKQFFTFQQNYLGLGIDFCVIDCGINEQVAYDLTPGAINKFDQCECIDQYIPVEGMPGVCEYDCAMYDANSNGLEEDSLDICACLDGFSWDSDLSACAIECRQDKNTEGFRSPGSVSECQCKYDKKGEQYVWDSSKGKCVRPKSISSQSSTSSVKSEEYSKSSKSSPSSPSSSIKSEEYSKSKKSSKIEKSMKTKKQKK